MTNKKSKCRRRYFFDAQGKRVAVQTVTVEEALKRMNKIMDKGKSHE